MEHLNASAESAGNDEDNGGEEEEAESEDGYKWSSPPPRAGQRNQIRVIIATHSPPTSTPPQTPPPTTPPPYQSYPCPPSRPHRGNDKSEHGGKCQQEKQDKSISCPPQFSLYCNNRFFCIPVDKTQHLDPLCLWQYLKSISKPGWRIRWKILILKFPYFLFWSQSS